MTRPETCGAAGGAVSFWVKVIECSFGGIISSQAYRLTGFQINCFTQPPQYAFDTELTLQVYLMMQLFKLKDVFNTSYNSSTKKKCFFVFLLFRHEGFFLTLSEYQIFVGDFLLSGWTHIALTVLSPRYTEHVRMFINGEVAKDTSRFTRWHSGDGRIVIGREFTDRDEGYTSMHIDELIFFNQALTDDNVHELYNDV